MLPYQQVIEHQHRQVCGGDDGVDVGGLPQRAARNLWGDPL